MKSNNYLLWWGIFLWILITYSRGQAQVSAEMGGQESVRDSVWQVSQDDPNRAKIDLIVPMVPVLSDGTDAVRRPFRSLVIVQAGSEGIVAARKRKYLPGARPSPGPHFCE